MQSVFRSILQLKQAGLLSGPRVLLESARRSTGEALDRHVNQQWTPFAGGTRYASAQAHLQDEDPEAVHQQSGWQTSPSGRGAHALEVAATIDPGHAEHPDVMLRSMTNQAAGPSGRHYAEQRRNGGHRPGNQPEPPSTSGQLSTLVRQLHKDRRLRDLVHVVDAFLLQNTDMHPSGRRQVRPGLSINVPTWHAYILALVGLKGATEKMLRALDLLKSQSHKQDVEHERAKIYSIVLQRLNMEAGSCDSRDRATWCARRAAAIIATLEASPAGWPGTPFEQISHYGYAIMACLGGKEHGPASSMMQTAEKLAEEEPWDVALGSRIYSGIMLMHVQGRRTALAHHYLRKANAAGIYITAASLQLAASYAAEMDDIDLLLTIMQCITRMQDQAPIASSTKINLDEGTLLAIITQAAGNGAVELAEVTWQVMMASITAEMHPVHTAVKLTEEQRARHAATRHSLSVPLPLAYHGLIHTYAKAGDFRSAFRTMAQLEAAYPDQEELVAWTPALAMLVDACASSIETADDAFYALESMHQQGETVSTPMVNCIVAACAQIGDLSRTFETFDALQTLGLSPDTNSYNAALLCCMCSDSLASAPKVLEELEQLKHLQHNALTHYLIVRYHLARRELPAAVAALYTMRDSGLQPSLELCDQVLLRCQRTGYYEGQQLMTKGSNPIIPQYVTAGRPRKAPIDVMGSGPRLSPTGRAEFRATSATPFGPRVPAAQQAARVAAGNRGYENQRPPQQQRQQQHQQQDQPSPELVWDA